MHPTNVLRLILQYKSWTAKYGYGRFFPVYVDKSGNPDGAPAEPVAKAVSQVAFFVSLFVFVSLCAPKVWGLTPSLVRQFFHGNPKSRHSRVARHR